MKGKKNIDLFTPNFIRSLIGEKKVIFVIHRDYEKNKRFFNFLIVHQNKMDDTIFTNSELLRDKTNYNSDEIKNAYFFFVKNN